MFGLLERLADAIARAMALFGGVLLLCVTAMTCVSILGRAAVPLQIGIGPVRGLYDYTEIAMAAAVFAFLPLCQLRRGHAQVDLMKPRLPATMNRFLDLIFDLGMLAIAVVGTQRLYLGLLDKQRYGETTLISQTPIWIGFALSLLGAIAFCAVATFCVLRSARALAERGPRHV